MISPVLLSRTLKKIPVTSKDRSEVRGRHDLQPEVMEIIRVLLSGVTCNRSGLRPDMQKYAGSSFSTGGFTGLKIKWGAYCRCPQ